MSKPTLPPLPAIDTRDSIPYESIRGVPGYAAPVVQRYASSYGLECYRAGMLRAAEIAEAEREEWATADARAALRDVKLAIWKEAE